MCLCEEVSRVFRQEWEYSHVTEATVRTAIMYRFLAQLCGCPLAWLRNARRCSWFGVR